jgi:hypothetical protein
MLAQGSPMVSVVSSAVLTFELLCSGIWVICEICGFVLPRPTRHTLPPTQLCLKSHGPRQVSALPPELASRRWLCPADSSQTIPGLCPWFGLGPSDLLGQRPHRGHSPNCKRPFSGRGMVPTSVTAIKKEGAPGTYSENAPCRWVVFTFSVPGSFPRRS